MATNFKGITIQLDIDNSNFEKEIKNTVKYVEAFENRLRQVDKALKLDPKNFDLISTRSQLLSEKTVQLENNIKGFQKALDDLKADGVADTDSRVIDLRTHLVNAQNELKKMREEMWKISTQKITKPLEDFEKATKSVGDALDTIASKFKWISATAGGMLGGAVKSAIDFNSAFASVRKTVDTGTDDLAEQEEIFQELSDAIRQTAKEIPVAATDFAELVGLAGQLGVGKDDVIEFTKTVADLGVATNLTSEEAGTMLAQFFNVTSKGEFGNVRNFASALVELGNNAATTEKDIMELAFRLSGAATNVGFTQQEILGLSTALASAGLNSEAAGGSISQVLQNIQKVVSGVADGSKDKLEAFAKVIGTTGEQFKKMWGEDAYGTFQLVIEGLGKLNEEDEDLITTLDELGIKSIRQTDSMSRLSLASETLAEYTNMANQAFTDNDALTVEAQRRYETFAAQITILKNNFTDLAITIGDRLTPYISKFSAFIKENGDAIADFVEKNADAIVKLLGFAAAIAPVAKAGSIFSKTLSGIAGGLKNIIQSKGLMNFITGIKTLGTTLSSWISQGTLLPNLITRIVQAINPVTLIIGAVVSVLVYLYTTVDSFRERVNSFVANIWADVLPVIQIVWDYIKKLADFIVGIFRPIVEGIIDLIHNRIAPILANVFGFIMDIIAVIVDLGSKLIQLLYPILNKLWEFMRGLFLPIWEIFIGFIHDCIDQVLSLVEWVTSLWDKFKETEWIQSLIEWFSSLDNIVETVKNKFFGFVGWVESAIDKVKNFLGLAGEAEQQDTAVNKILARNNGNGARQIATGGFGFASGGMTSNVTINVNNNGRNITANEVRRWATIINDELGGSF